MPGSAVLSAASATSPIDSIGTPLLWAGVIGAVVLLLAVDFVLTRRPHEVGMREALGWSAFYIALPLAFGVYVWSAFGSERGVEYLTGYLVEKSLSVDNLFVFILLLSAFAVPRELRQRVLLYGIIGALVLRAIFIALGAAALQTFDWTFLVFGLVLVATAVKILRDTLTGQDHDVDVDRMRSVRLVRRVVPVTSDYESTRLLSRIGGRRALTPARAGVARRAGDRHRLRHRLRARGLRHHRRPVPGLRHQRLRAARAPGALLRARGRPGPARAPGLRTRRHPRLHRGQARPALGAPAVGRRCPRSRRCGRWWSSSASWPSSP